MEKTISDGFHKVQDPEYVLPHGIACPSWQTCFFVLADVGQSCWEEINVVTLNNRANLGWAEMEGFQPVDGSASCESSNENYSNDEGYTMPVAIYGHTGGNCSITGGFWMDSDTIV